MTSSSAGSSTSGVRQTAQTGPVTTAGLPSFMPATSSGSSVSSQNITVSFPLVVTAAGGNVDRTGTRTTDLSWSGLSVTNNVINFGYVDIDADGTMTTGVTVQAPIYQQGGTPAATSGLTTFNIGEMRGYTGNGSTAPQSYRVFLWEGTGDGTNVANIVAYAYNGQFVSAEFGYASGTAYDTNHNIGVIPRNYNLVAVCKTTDLGWPVGAELQADAYYNASHGPTSRNVNRASTYAGVNYQTVYDATSQSGMTLANWKLKYYISRGW